MFLKFYFVHELDYPLNCVVKCSGKRIFLCCGVNAQTMYFVPCCHMLLPLDYLLEMF